MHSPCPRRASETRPPSATHDEISAIKSKLEPLGVPISELLPSVPDRFVSPLINIFWAPALDDAAPARLVFLFQACKGQRPAMISIVGRNDWLPFPTSSKCCSTIHQSCPARAGESRDGFQCLFESFELEGTHRPKTDLEYLWVYRAVVATWELMRYERMKVLITVLERRPAVESLHRKISADTTTDQEFVAMRKSVREGRKSTRITARSFRITWIAPTSARAPLMLLPHCNR